VRNYTHQDYMQKKLNEIRKGTNFAHLDSGTLPESDLMNESQQFSFTYTPRGPQENFITI